jgi:hypothetical protein
MKNIAVSDVGMTGGGVGNAQLILDELAGRELVEEPRFFEHTF